MTNKKEITATEKLLDLIRAGSSPEPAVQDLPSPDEREQPVEPPHSTDDLELELESGPLVGGSGPTVFASHQQSEPDIHISPGHPHQAPEMVQAEEPLYSDEHPTPFQNETADATWIWYKKEQNNKFPTCLANLFRRTKIGIDIHPGHVHIVKAEITKTKHNLLACESHSYQKSDDNEELTDLWQIQSLKTVLSQKLSSLFSCELRKPELWCTYTFANPISIYNITIPTVSPKDLPATVYWTIKKEGFDEKQSIIDFTIFKEVETKGQKKLQVIVTIIPKRELSAIKNLFNELGYPLTGLTFSAASIQNFLHIYHPEPTSSPIVYFTIRDTNSFIDLFYQGKMLFSREIKTGIESFVESIQSYATANNIQIDDNTAKSLIFDLFDGKKVNKNPENHRQLADSIDFDALPVIDRLIRQLLRTFEYCTTNFKIPNVEMIYTAGTSVLNDKILTSIQQRLGITCAIIKPFGEEIFNFDAPLRLTPELNILPAVGLALSNKQTTKNFLFTYLERARYFASRRTNKIIAYATIGLALSVGVLFAIQYTAITDKREQVRELENSLEQKYALEPQTRSAEQLIPLIATIKESHRHYKQSINRFKVLGIIQEITRDMPKEARLTNISIKLPSTEPVDGSADSSGKKIKGESEAISLSGIISGPQSRQEFILLTILKKLGDLKFLFDPILESTKTENINESAALSFKIKIAVQNKLTAGE
nr:hypothetical protein [Desulfobulbaceae bacterium]